MQSRISVKLTAAAEWLPAILSDERAESSYGLPVVIVDGEDFARGTGEVAAVRVSSAVDPELIDAARRAGFRVEEGQPMNEQQFQSEMRRAETMRASPPIRPKPIITPTTFAVYAARTTGNDSVLSRNMNCGCPSRVTSTMNRVRPWAWVPRRLGVQQRKAAIDMTDEIKVTVCKYPDWANLVLRYVDPTTGRQKTEVGQIRRRSHSDRRRGRMAGRIANRALSGSKPAHVGRVSQAIRERTLGQPQTSNAIERPVSPAINSRSILAPTGSAK